jgi:hypothetical protein
VVPGDGASVKSGMDPGAVPLLLDASAAWMPTTRATSKRATRDMLDVPAGGEHHGRRRVESALWRRPGAAPNRWQRKIAGDGWVGVKPKF